MIIMWIMMSMMIITKISYLQFASAGDVKEATIWLITHFLSPAGGAHGECPSRAIYHVHSV